MPSGGPTYKAIAKARGVIVVKLCDGWSCSFEWGVPKVAVHKKEPQPR